MAGYLNVSDISNLEVAKPTSKQKPIKPTPKHKQHIELLENRVDELELEVVELKRQLALKPKVDTKNYKELYEKAIEKLHVYWESEHPF